MILTIQLPATSYQPPDQLAYALCSLLLCSLAPMFPCSLAPLLLSSLSPALCSPALWLRNIAGSPLRSDMLPALLVLSGVDVCSLLIYCYFYPFINY